MAKPKVRIHSRGVVELLKDPKLTSAIESGVGAELVTRMDASAPVDSGALSRSHRVWSEEHGDRTVVRIGSDLPYTAAVALRTGYMARALDGA